MHPSPVFVGIDVAKAKLDVALIACMRKLLTMLNAMVKHQQTWQPQPAKSL